MPSGTVLVAALAAALTLATGASAAGRPVTLTLDWTPNPDHVGFYDARDTGLFAKAGLDVTIRAPSDPTAPLKLVGVGRSDLAVSYEQELFFAAAKKLPVVAVAAVVPQPLNSLIAIEPKIHSLRDLARPHDRDHRRPLRLRDARHAAPLDGADAQGREGRHGRLQPPAGAARPSRRRRARRLPERRGDPAAAARTPPDDHPGRPRRRAQLRRARPRREPQPPPVGRDLPRNREALRRRVPRGHRRRAQPPGACARDPAVA